MATRFDFAGYGDLISDLRRAGYRIRMFDECASPDRGDLLLRHDVDYCLSTAVGMASIEADLGITSTWFILVRSPLFNPFGAGERELLRSLRHKGGRIGLQFDASYYPEAADVDALAQEAEDEIAALEIASAGPVVAVSFHKPPPCLRDFAAPFAGRPHCSEPRFVRDIIYCSDTLAEFSYGEPLEHARSTDLRAMQLLTHPIWWSEQSSIGGLAKLDRLAQRRADAALDAIERSVTLFNRSTSRT
jgi:hypothetical protein